MPPVRPRGADRISKRPAGMVEKTPHPNSTGAGRRRVASVIVRDRGLCQRCGQIPLTPEVHHIDGDRDNQEMDNLVLLCRPCHLAAHGGSWRRKPDPPGEIANSMSLDTGTDPEESR